MATVRTPTIFILILTAALAGCVADDAPSGDEMAGELPVWTMPAIPALDAKTLLADHAAFVSKNNHRAWNSPGHESARVDLQAVFAETGLELWVQKFTNGIDQVNVCAAKIGTVAPDVWVIVGGHYDTTTNDANAFDADAPNGQTSQGAYDDGSGTWLTLQLARSYAGLDSYYSILFCAFDGEERGLQGSQAVFQATTQDPEFTGDAFPWEISETRGMIDLDMMGINWPVRAPIYFDQNHPVVKERVDAIRTEMGIPDDMFKFQGITLGQSDYAHWYGSGVATGFFISDFEELMAPVPGGAPAPFPTVPGAYPFWHQQDTVETMTAMAGGQDGLEAGFQTALELAAGLLHMMAMDATADLTPAA